MIHVDKKYRKFVKEYSRRLGEIGVPSFIIENREKWFQFIETGWDPHPQELGWWFEGSQEQALEIYWLLKTVGWEEEFEFIDGGHMNEVSRFQIREISSPKKQEFEFGSGPFFDFFINEKSLSEVLGIERFSLPHCSFDLDLLASSKNDKVQWKNLKRVVQVFLGNQDAENQFGSGRVVLYRCHCGCDYCGVISFILDVDELRRKVIWRDIRFEDDEDRLPLNSEELSFSMLEYDLAFKKYLEKR